jgi:hypothetical protein
MNNLGKKITEDELNSLIEGLKKDNPSLRQSGNSKKVFIEIGALSYEFTKDGDEFVLTAYPQMVHDEKYESKSGVFQKLKGTKSRYYYDRRKY